VDFLRSRHAAGGSLVVTAARSISSRSLTLSMDGGGDGGGDRDEGEVGARAVSSWLLLLLLLSVIFVISDLDSILERHGERRVLPLPLFASFFLDSMVDFEDIDFEDVDFKDNLDDDFDFEENNPFSHFTLHPPNTIFSYSFFV